MTREQILNDPTLRKLCRCECTDFGCPAHKGISECHNTITSHLYRTDIDDLTGVLFCDECATDALDSGVFTTKE